MKVRIGYGLGTQGLAVPSPGDGVPVAGVGVDYAAFVDDLERLEFDSLWFSERINGDAPDPCSAMAFAAGRTKKLKLGMSVMVLPGRNPVLVAKELASIDMLSGGRLLPAFGLGVADAREHAGFGVKRELRGPMFDEALGLIRRLWTQDDVSHDGTHYSCADVTVRPRPVQSPPDVWLGGFAPSELRRVGRMGDGWLPSFITVAEAPALRKQVEEAAAAHQRTIDPEHFGVLIAYSSGTPMSGRFLERIRARRPDIDPAALFPVGMPAVTEMVKGFIGAGFSKFVLIPTIFPRDMRSELETVAAAMKPLEN